MGADLIGFMVFGPKTITKTEAEIKAYFDAHKQFVAPESGDEGAPMVIKTDHIPDPVKEVGAFRLTVADLSDLPDDEEEALENAITFEEFKKGCEQFLEFWNEENGRDSRFSKIPMVPGYKAVFAGEMSWGEEPDGWGYSRLNFVSRFDLWGFFGIQ